MHARRLLLPLCVLLTLPFANAFAADCGNPTPRESPIWSAFYGYVSSNYLAGGGFHAREYAIGHALGRVAAAVRGDPEKEEAFDCIETGIQQLFGFDVVYGWKDVRYKRAMQAAMGMHDKLVADTFKVTDSSPLDAVFDEAFKTVGRTPSGTGGTAAGSGATGTIVKSDPADMFGVSSTAPSSSGSNTSCTTGDRWSLAKAQTLLNSVTGKAGSVGKNCASAAWQSCRDISNTLHEARDHIFQVFDQNHDGIANCRLCNYDRAIDMAARLVEWEKWLLDRYYDASGLSTIYYTIQDHRGDPLCQADAAQPASASSATGAAGAGGPASAQSSTHPCADPNVQTDATWLFYRWGLGGGATGYSEKQGLICYGNNYYYTYRGSSMDGYRCTGNWENCKAVPGDVYVYTDIKTNADGSKSYEYQSGYGTRKE